MIGVHVQLSDRAVRDAVAFDLMGMGLSIRDFPDGGVTYGDVRRMLTCSGPGSAVWQTKAEHPQRTYEVDLLARIDYQMGVMVKMWAPEDMEWPAPEYADLPWVEKPEAEPETASLSWEDGMRHYFHQDMTDTEPQEV